MLGDLAVNRMGFGAMRLAGAQSGMPGDRAQAIRVLRRAVDPGPPFISVPVDDR